MAVLPPPRSGLRLTRPLAAVGISLLLLGIEVATGAVSIAAVRLWGGVGALLAGDEFVISAARTVIGGWLVLGGAALVGIVIYAELARARILDVGEVCPRCGNATRRVRRHRLHRLLFHLLEVQVIRRACAKCGWKGLTA